MFFRLKAEATRGIPSESPNPRIPQSRNPEPEPESRIPSGIPNPESRIPICYTLGMLLLLVISPPSPRVVTADRGDAGLRIDLVLRRHLTDVRAASRTRVQAWIEGGQVTVNGRVVRRVSARAAIGDVVTVVLPPSTTRQPMVHEDVPLRILFEDDFLLIVDKPAGVVVHPTHKHAAGTLMNALLWYARTWPAGSRPSIVGRLDKLTSGLVIVAKTAAIHAAVQREWGASRTMKDYLAVVYGRVGIRGGDIELRLRRDPSDRRRVVASPTLGAPSLTRFERVGTGSGAARRAVAAALSPGHRAHAPDSRAPRNEGVAHHRRSGIRAAALEGNRGRGTRGGAARFPAAGAACVACRAEAPARWTRGGGRGAGACGSRRATRDRTARSDAGTFRTTGTNEFESEPEARAEGIRPSPDL